MIWEYKTYLEINRPIGENTLNLFGVDGWELVAAYEYETTDVKYYFHYIFKRPKPFEVSREYRNKIKK